MFLKFFFIPLLIAQLNIQQNHTYVWKRHNLSLSTPVVMEVIDDKDYWDLENEESEFWIEIERYDFSEEPSIDLMNVNVKDITLKFAKEIYDNVTDGGPIPNIPNAHFAISNEDGMISFYAFIIDKKNKSFYEIYMDDVENIQSFAYQVINSLRFLN